VLIFASDMPGGYGGIDLWYSVYNKKSKSWSSPRNMGKDINTEGDEMFPTMGEDGILYFSSNGHVGMGGLDIFMAERVGDEIKWKKPTNLGHPINSCANDFHFIATGERNGYFTSNRPHTDAQGAYRDNIWSWELPPNISDLCVNVYESGTIGGPKGPPIADAKVKITGSDGSSWEGLTNDEGQVCYEVKPDGSRYINEETSYKIVVSKDGEGDQGYYANDATISTIGMDRGQSFVKDIPLIGKRPIRLPEVRYALGLDVLLVDATINSKDSLNYVLELLNYYPTLIIQLTSHTDYRGSAASNKDLSQRRAQACVNYLVKEKGVNPARLRARGAGREQSRTIYYYNGDYHVEKPDPKSGTEYETIVLTNEYINQYKSNKALFERLHQYNRRTEGEVVSFDFDPETAGEGSIEIEDITEGEEEE
jgi:outer membrane protein OmpA-like peptidoglycan-associated protein